MAKVFIQDKENSHLGSNIYVVYDRKHKVREQLLWLSADLGLPIPEVRWFVSEPEAREWLTNIANINGWLSKSSEAFIIELPKEASVMIMLDNDPSKRLQEELTIDVIEQLWREQYSNEDSDASSRE